MITNAPKYQNPQNNIDNNQYFNYSRRSDGESLVLEASLLLDGKHRFDNNLFDENW